MRRAQRRLTAAGGRIRLAGGPAELERAATALTDLHAGRWSARGGSNLDPGPTAALLADAALALGPDHLRLWVVELDDRPVAVQAFAAAGGEVVYWNGGWDERHAAVKPALLAILAAVEDAFARGERRVDFGAGEHPYKLRFAGQGDGGSLTWSGLFPVDRRYPLTRARLAPRQVEWWARRTVRRLPPQRRERLKRLIRRSRRGG
jgi:CelD/BcsL family acetyltransferase involved in cellulose biosynthesis